MFVQPQMGDGGLCLGAAAGLQHYHNVNIKPLHDMYLGPDIGEFNIQTLAVKYPHLNFVNPENLIDSVINELQSSNVIGLARGRMEFGPRALCHRSIIYKNWGDRCACRGIVEVSRPSQGDGEVQEK